MSSGFLVRENRLNVESRWCTRAYNVAKRGKILRELYTELRAAGLQCVTIYNILNTAKRLLTSCGIDNISERCVKAFLAGKTKSTHYNTRKFLIFLYKMTGDIRFKKIHDSIKTPKKRLKLPQVLSEEQIRKIIEDTEDFKKKAVLAVLYETGMRISELLAIKFKDIEPFEHGFKIRITRSKSVPRTVIVVEYAHILSAWLNTKKWGQEERIFPYTDTRVRKWLYKIGDAHGIKLHPHMLRHSRATHLYGKLSEKELMILFGWRKRDMLDVYAHLKESDAHMHLLQLYGLQKKREEEKEELKKCPRCGTMNSFHANYCVKCGYPLNPEAIQHMLKKQAEKDILLQELKRLAEEINSIKERLGD